MPIQLIDVLVPACAYMIGSVPFGYLVAKARGIDIRREGSGNVGATNVGRVLGRPLGIVVFVLDFLKGAIPSGLAVWWRGGADGLAIAVGLCAVLGHMFSVFLRFRGGKGVATAAGAVMVLLPGPTALAVLAFTATILAGQFMSLASIVGAIVLAGAQLSLSHELFSPASLFAILAAGLIIIRHRTNISRLRTNTESQLNSLKRFANLCPVLHILALALWFGAGWFFSMGIATQLFSTFNALAKAPPDWLPLSDESVKELGNRLAGTAVAPIFPRYFLLQAICGIIAAGCAVGWAVRCRVRCNKIHAILLILALIVVAVGWPVNRVVSDLRMARYGSDSARTAFATWHFVSLFLNLGALVLVTPALAMSPFIAREHDESSPDATGGL